MLVGASFKCEGNPSEAVVLVSDVGSGDVDDS